MASPLNTSAPTHAWHLTEASGTRSPFLGAVSLTESGGSTGQGVGKLNATCASFGGVNNRKLIAASLTDWTGDYTIAAWVYLNASTTSGTIVSSGNFWIGDNSFEITVTANRVYFDFFKASGSNSLSSGVIPATGWYLVIARHDATNKKLSLLAMPGFASATVETKITRVTYTGTARVPSPANATWVGERDHAGGGYTPFNSLIDELIMWRGRCLSDKECLALHNSRAGLVYSTWDTAYPSNSTIPGVSQTLRVAATKQSTVFAAEDATIPGGVGTLDTTRVRFAATKTIVSPVIEWANGVTFFGAGAVAEGCGEDNYTTPTSITIAASALPPGDAAVTNLEFSGASTKFLAYSDRVVSDADELSDRVIFPGELIYINTRVAPATGAKIPANRQLAGASGEGSSGNVDKLSSVVSGDFPNNSGLYYFGPTQLLGYPQVLGTRADAAVVQLGDSISDGPDKYAPVALAASGATYTAIGKAGEKAQDQARTLGGKARRAIASAQQTLWIQSGVNDVQASRTATQIKADIATIIAAAVAGSTRKVLISYPTPTCDQFNAILNATRNDLVTFYDASTSSDWGTMTGCKALLHHWDGSAWVASGSRSGGAGNVVDIYLLDQVCKSIETSFPTVTGTWTSVATNCSDTGTSNRVHPSAAAITNIVADIQPQLNAALAAALPEPSSTADEDEEIMTIGSNTRGVAATAGAAELLAQDGDVVEVQVQGNTAGGYICAVDAGDPAPDPTDTDVHAFRLDMRSASERAYTLDGQDLYGWSAGGTCKFVLNGTMAALP